MCRSCSCGPAQVAVAMRRSGGTTKRVRTSFNIHDRERRRCAGRRRSRASTGEVAPSAIHLFNVHYSRRRPRPPPLTCSLALLMPSGPSRLTACFTRSVRPQLSMRKPRSCRNFASVAAASSLREAQTQSSVLKGKKRRTHTAGKACCGSIISEQPDRINVFFFPSSQE